MSPVGPAAVGGVGRGTSGSPRCRRLEEQPDRLDEDRHRHVLLPRDPALEAFRGHVERIAERVQAVADLHRAPQGHPGNIGILQGTRTSRTTSSRLATAVTIQMRYASARSPVVSSPEIQLENHSATTSGMETQSGMAGAVWDLPGQRANSFWRRVRDSNPRALAG